MLYWLSEAAYAARDASGENIALIAGLAQCDPRTVRRFEDSEHWPRELDEILAAYAQVAGLEDPRQLWQAALDLWYEHGQAPLISRREDRDRERMEGLQQRFAERIAKQAPRTPPRDRDEPAQEPNANPKRRATRR